MLNQYLWKQNKCTLEKSANYQNFMASISKVKLDICPPKSTNINYIIYKIHKPDLYYIYLNNFLLFSFWKVERRFKV